MADDEFGDDVDFSELINELDSAPASSTTQSERIAITRGPPSSTVGVQSESRPKIVQPVPQAIPHRAGPSSILASTRQRGNPILDYVKNVPWEYADVPADYVVGQTTCVLFLSLKYHRLHPEYIYSRVKLLGGKYNLRILLAMVDIPNHEESLRELSKTSIINDLTLILCWSAAEAGHYLELFKSCEHAQPTAIRTQQARSYKESLEDFITAPRAINKSDAASLVSTFGSLKNAINAHPDQIVTVPGWGDRKVKQWCSAVREDFKIERGLRSRAPPKPRSTQTPFSISQSLPAKQSQKDEDFELLLAIKESLVEAGKRPTADPSDTRDYDRTSHVEETAETTIAPASSDQNTDRPNDEMSSGIATALERLRRQE